MNKFKNKWIFIVAILVIILGMIIYSNKDDITNLISTSTKDTYDSIIASDNDVEICRNKKPNKNFILAAYEYNDTVLDTQEGYCISGTESTCPAGTIINYMVSPTTSVYFYVLHDDGGVMTLQSVNEITKSAWGNKASEGPVTALTAITEATKDWSNVNDLTYTLGETIFLKYPNNSSNANPYNNCIGYDCTSNLYTLSSELTTNVKARILSGQEAADIGCTKISNSCPNWMNSNVNGYWISNCYPTSGAYMISSNSIQQGSYASTARPLLAVVEINK
jgi:hypothetical protein